MPIIKDSSGSDSEMDSLYSEEEPDSSTDKSDTKEESEVEGHTELISKKLINGKTVKKGDKVILTVVQDFGDDVEVSYRTEKSSGNSERDADEELDALSA